MDKVNYKIERAKERFRIRQEERMERWEEKKATWENNKGTTMYQPTSHQSIKKSTLKRVKKPTKPFYATWEIISSLFWIGFWITFKFYADHGQFNILGNEFLALTDIAIKFILIQCIIWLIRAMVGIEHYYVQSTFIIAHTIISVIFIYYTLQFTGALLANERLVAFLMVEDTGAIEAIVKIPKVLAAVQIICFGISIYQAITYKEKYLKYERQLEEYNEYKQKKRA